MFLCTSAFIWTEILFPPNSVPIFPKQKEPNKGNIYRFLYPIRFFSYDLFIAAKD